MFYCNNFLRWILSLTNNYFLYFNNFFFRKLRRKFEFVVQGRFLRPVPFSSVYTGQVRQNNKTELNWIEFIIIINSSINSLIDHFFHDFPLILSIIFFIIFFTIIYTIFFIIFLPIFSIIFVIFSIILSVCPSLSLSLCQAFESCLPAPPPRWLVNFLMPVISALQVRKYTELWNDIPYCREVWSTAMYDNVLQCTVLCCIICNVLCTVQYYASLSPPLTISTTSLFFTPTLRLSFLPNPLPLLLSFSFFPFHFLSLPFSSPSLTFTPIFFPFPFPSPSLP